RNSTKTPGISAEPRSSPETPRGRKCRASCRTRSESATETPPEPLTERAARRRRQTGRARTSLRLAPLLAADARLAERDLQRVARTFVDAKLAQIALLAQLHAQALEHRGFRFARFEAKRGFPF